MPTREEPTHNSRETAKRQPKRRRKWLRRLVWLILLVGAALAVNGPVFRWALDKFPKDILRDNGLSAEYTVSGTLLGPWQIHDATIKNPKTGTLITIDEIHLALDWWNTIRREIAQPVDEVRITNAEVTLDLRRQFRELEDPASRSDEDEAESGGTSSDQSRTIAERTQSTFNTLEKYIGHTSIDLDLRKFHVIGDDDMEWQLSKTHITHQPGAEIELDVGTAVLPGKEKISNMGVIIDPINDSVSIRQVAIKEDLAIERADISVADGSMKINLLASLFGGQLAITSPDLNIVNLELKSGTISIPDALDFVRNLIGVNIRIPSGSITELDANINLDGGAWPQGINGDLDLSVDDLITYGITIGDTEILINKTGPEITVRELKVNTPGALVRITNAVTDATQFTTRRFWNQIPAENIRVEMRDLHDTLQAYRVELGDHFPKIQGTVTASTSPAPDKEAMMPAANLTANIQPVDPSPALDAMLKVETDGHFASTMDVQLTVNQGKNPDPIINSTTTFTIDTLGYTTDTKIAIKQEDTVNRILQWLGRKPVGEITTTLRVDGTGTVDKLDSHEGSLIVDSLEFNHDDLFPVTASTSISYENSTITAENLEAHFEGFAVDLKGTYARERLDLRHLTVKHEDGAAKLLASASLPLDDNSFGNPLSIITRNKSLTVNLDFQSPDLKEITPLLKLAGLDQTEADIESGPISLKANIERTPEKPLGFTIDANASKILIAADPNRAPIDINLHADSANNARLDGTITYGEIGKVLAKGEMTWQPKRWADEPEEFLDEEFTIDLTVDKMPVDFVKNLTDFIPEIEGELSITAKGSGTIKTPEVSGTLDLGIDKAKFNTPYFPGVDDLRFTASLEDQLITINEGHFDSAGGDYRIGGNMDISNMTDPVFNLTIVCREGLIFRNEAITARADTDLSLKGPLSDALLSGTIGIIQGLYYREIRILSPSSTLGVNDGPDLPKFEKSVEDAQMAVAGTPGILENIKLDVRVYSKEPIRVRSNLARANINLDVQAMNTLSDPQLKGKATITNGSAQLPLSSLRIVDGNAIFTPEQGFIPSLNIHALSKPGRYRVNIYISGPADSPNVIMTSNPPLPQSEIYSLLATGSTREDLSGGGTAALKAAMLLTQEISTSNDSLPFQAMNKVFDLVNNLNVNIGETDRLTGRQTHSARVSITDRLAIRVEYDEADTSASVVYEIPLK